MKLYKYSVSSYYICAKRSLAVCSYFCTFLVLSTSAICRCYFLLWNLFTSWFEGCSILTGVHMKNWNGKLRKTPRVRPLSWLFPNIHWHNSFRQISSLAEETKGQRNNPYRRRRLVQLSWRRVGRGAWSVLCWKLQSECRTAWPFRGCTALLQATSTPAAQPSQVGALVNPCHLFGHEQRPLINVLDEQSFFPRVQSWGKNSSYIVSWECGLVNPVPYIVRVYSLTIPQPL